MIEIATMRPAIPDARLQLNRKKQRTKKQAPANQVLKPKDPGVICACGKQDADSLNESGDWMELTVEVKGSVLPGMTVFMFDQESGRLYGIYEAWQFSSETKAIIRTQEKCVPLDAHDLAEHGYDLNKFPKSLGASQVAQLKGMFLARTRALERRAGYRDNRFADGYLRQQSNYPLEAHFQPGTSFEDDTEKLVPEGIYTHGTTQRVNYIDPFPVPYNPPRAISPGNRCWKPELAKDVLCAPREPVAQAFSHSVANQRGVPDAEVTGFPRQNTLPSAPFHFNQGICPRLHAEDIVPEKLAAHECVASIRPKRNLEPALKPCGAEASAVKVRGNNHQTQMQAQKQTQPAVKPNVSCRLEKATERTTPCGKKNGASGRAPAELKDRAPSELRKARAPIKETRGSKVSVFARIQRGRVFDRISAPAPSNQLNSDNTASMKKRTASGKQKLRVEPVQEIQEGSDESEEEQEDERFIVNFRRRSSRSASSPTIEENLGEQQTYELRQHNEEPKPKRRRFIRPDGLGPRPKDITKELRLVGCSVAGCPEVVNGACNGWEDQQT